MSGAEQPRYELLNTPDDYGNDDLPVVSECSRCGAVVRDQQQHTEWHAELELIMVIARMTKRDLTEQEARRRHG